MARKTLSMWINEALVDPDKPDKISAIALVHLVGQQRQEIHTVRINAGSNYDGESLEKLLRGKAEAYAQDLDTVQTFALLAFYGTNASEQAIFPFKVLPQADPSTMPLSTEAPTPEGRLMQKMRWDDALQMQVYRRQQTLDDHTIRIIEQQNRILAQSQTMLEQVMRDNMSAFTVVKELLNERALNQHNHRVEQLRLEENARTREKLLKFAPALVNTIVGKEVFPQSSADTALIETIAENLTAEHVAMLGQLLPPELAGPLANRIAKAIQDKEARDNELKKQLPQYQGTAEEDIGGGT